MAKHAKTTDSPNASRYVAMAQERRRKRRSRRIMTGVLCALAVCVLAVGGYALWFKVSLDSALSRHTDADVLDDLYETMSDQPFYMLVLGSDTRHDETVGHDVAMQTDVIMLVRVDQQAKKVTMLSVPRDTPWKLDSGETVKINSMYNRGGVQEVVKAVNKLTGLPISHYAMVYLSDLKGIVDTVGGVEVDVPIEINNNDPETEENVNLQPGVQMLDGQQAQAFCISRHEAEGPQESYRQSKIRTLMTAVATKVLHLPIYEIPPTVVSLADYVETDLRTNNFISMAMSFSSGGITVYSATGPSDGDFYAADGDWYCYENPEGWAQAVALTDAGEDPSNIDYAATQIVP